jgi:predicted kinase
MENTLYIVRGIPGSGKSTFAKTLGGQHYEADMFFIDEEGNYNFDFTKIKDAHQWCQGMVKSDMILEYPKIVVSNTFTQEWEMKPYIDMAKEFGYVVFTIVVENRHGGVNEHNVPEDKIEQMKNRFEIKL